MFKENNDSNIESIEQKFKSNDTNSNNVKIHHNKTSSIPKTNLQRMLDSEKMIRAKKKEEIKEEKPLISQGNKPFIYPNTIAMIQGQSGSHKSRIAGTIVASVLKAPTCTNDTMGLTVHEEVHVIYIDTERNQSSQIPKAIQMIQTAADIPHDVDPINLNYASLLDINRPSRFDTLKEYIRAIRNKIGQEIHLLIVLDVVSDLVKDFNDSISSLLLTDFLNTLINDEDCTIVAVLHENPNSHKARGHLGTELTNKASTVIQVSVSNADENTIKVLFKKTRNTKLPEPFYVTIDEKTGSLIELASNYRPKTIESSSKIKMDDFKQTLAELIKEPLLRSTVLEILMQKYQCKDRTIEDIFKNIVEKNITIPTKDGEMVFTKIKKGKELYYALVNPISTDSLQNNLEINER